MALTRQSSQVPLRVSASLHAAPATGRARARPGPRRCSHPRLRRHRAPGGRLAQRRPAANARAAARAANRGVAGSSVQRRVDEMSTVRTQAGQAGDRGEQPPDRVGHRVRDEQRRLTHDHQSRRNRDVIAEADTIAVGTVAAICGDRQPRRTARRLPHRDRCRVDPSRVAATLRSPSDARSINDRNTAMSSSSSKSMTMHRLPAFKRSKNARSRDGHHRHGARPRPSRPRAPACASNPPASGPAHSELMSITSGWEARPGPGSVRPLASTAVGRSRAGPWRAPSIT